MKKILASLLLLALFAIDANAQTESKIHKPSIGFNFVFTDFKTAGFIRSNSLSAAMRDRKLFKADGFNYGFAVNYMKGLTPHVDFSSSLACTFSTQINIPGRTNSSGNDLIELDASGHFKMFPEGMKFNPYLIGGIGVSKYTNIIGALIPVGGGLRFRVVDEFEVYSEFQYRIPVVKDANDYHFQISFGITSPL